MPRDDSYFDELLARKLRCIGICAFLICFDNIIISVPVILITDYTLAKFRYFTMTVYAVFAAVNIALCFIKFCKNKLAALFYYNLMLCFCCCCMLLDFLLMITNPMGYSSLLVTVCAIILCYYSLTLKTRVEKEAKKVAAQADEAAQMTTDIDERPKFGMQISVDRVECDGKAYDGDVP